MTGLICKRKMKLLMLCSKIVLSFCLKLFWNKKTQNVTEKLKVFLGLRKKLFSWKHMLYQLRSTMKTDQSPAASKFSRLAINLITC